VATATFWRTFHHDGKLAQDGEGGGCTPTPFNYIYHHVYKVIVYAPAEGRYTHHISTLTLCVLCGCKSEVDADVAMLMPQQQGLNHSSKGSTAARVPQH